MEQSGLMALKILLPSQIFAEKRGILRIIAETPEGSFGLLPRRLDCVAAITPGILTYESKEEGEIFTAVDEGVLIKTGLNVLISVRNAIGGTDLDRLRETVEKEFSNLEEREQKTRSVMARMESDFIRRLAEFNTGKNGKEEHKRQGCFQPEGRSEGEAKAKGAA